MHIRGKSFARLIATYRLIDQLFDPSCVPSGAVRNMERDNIIRTGLEHVVRTVCLQIALKGPLAMMRSIELGSVANPPPGVEVYVAGTRIVETF